MSFIDSSRVDVALRFVGNARSDFEASKLLFERGFYHQGLFYLQQSIEKLSKAIIYVFGVIEFKDLPREIGHQVFQRGIMVIAEKLSIKVMEPYPSDKPLVTKSITDYVKNIKKDSLEFMSKIKDNLFKRVGEVDLSGLDSFNSLKDLIFKPEETVREVIRNTYKSRNLPVRKLLRKYRLKPSDELVMKLSEDTMKSIKPIIRDIFLLIILAILSVVHLLFEDIFSILRYPSEQRDPRSITDETVITFIARNHIIKLIEEMNMFSIVEDFVSGNLRCEESIRIYGEFMKQ